MEEVCAILSGCQKGLRAASSSTALDQLRVLEVPRAVRPRINYMDCDCA